MQNFNFPVNNMVNGNQGGYNNPPYYSQPYNGNNQMASYGYNPMGGYYNNNYTLYNPYLLEEQRKAEEAQRRNQLRQNSNIMKTLSRKVHHALGQEISDEMLDKIYDPVELHQPTKDELKIEKMERLIQMNEYRIQTGLMFVNPMYVAMGKVQEYHQKRLNPDMDLYEFLSIGGEIISENMRNEAIMKSKRIDNLYNRSDYQKLIDLRSRQTNNFSNTFNPNANIDDMTISLPEKLKTEYQRRKELFLERIINGGVR